MTDVIMPRSLDALWDVLENRPEAALMAGGTDLLVHRRAGVVDPECMVCLERIDALHGIQETPGGMWIGAMATHAQVTAHPAVVQRIPILAEAVGSIGAAQIRHMGTLGGNICTASPAGDSLPALAVLDADVEIARRGGRRRMPLENFILGPGRTQLAAGEVVTRIRVPWPQGYAVSRYLKVGRRRAMACAVVSLAALVALTTENTIAAARLAWGAVGPTVARSRRLEDALAGTPFTRDGLRGHRSLAAEGIHPIDDIRAGADYRRSVALNLFLSLPPADH